MFKILHLGNDQEGHPKNFQSEDPNIINRRDMRFQIFTW